MRRPIQLACGASALSLFCLITPVRAQDLTSAATGRDAGHSSHIGLGATAHALPAGTGYFEMTQLFVPRVQVGVTDRMSVGVGNAAFTRLVFVTPKVQIYRSDNVSAAVGVMHLFGAPEFSGGVAYSVMTVDRPREGRGSRWSFTGGAGLAYGHDGKESGRIPIASFSVEARRSEHSTNVIHSYIHSTGAIVMASHRHTWTNWWVDYGILVSVARPAVTVPGPVLSFGRRF